VVCWVGAWTFLREYWNVTSQRTNNKQWTCMLWKWSTSTQTVTLPITIY
jgi:hypothetical protein